MKAYLSLGMAASVLVFTIAGAAQTTRRAPARPARKGAPSPAPQGLRQRVETYYRDIQANKKSEALELVTPESRDEFFKMDYHALLSFRIQGVQLGKAGSTATVEMVRSERIPPFLQALDIPVKDTWKRIHGRWFLVLPKPNAAATPLGPMQVGPASASGAAAPMQSPNQGPQVTPQQAMAALQKAMSKEGKTLPLAQVTPPTQKVMKKPATQQKSDGTSQNKSNPASTPH